MRPIKVKIWITWALILFSLGLAADYFFLHLLFQQKQQALSESLKTGSLLAEPGDKSSSLPESVKETTPADSGKNTFLDALKKCAPEIAAQTIATPEALIEYLQKSIGIKHKEIPLENYHLTLDNGDQRRIQILVDDNTNSSDKKELRFFKLDQEGIPERLALSEDETLESLLSKGKITRHEVRSELVLKDGSSLNLEMHDNKVFEFQYNNHGQLLSCRFQDCLCPTGRQL